MPAQSTASKTEYYVDHSTAPALRKQLLDIDGEPIDLTGSTVTISIAFSMPRETYWTSPRRRIVDAAPCVPDPDQVANMGYVEWTPGGEGSDSDLTPPGSFLLTFEITESGG
ncbi:unnamed protein product, partial [marine sediment metagenome]